MSPRRRFSARLIALALLAGLALPVAAQNAQAQWQAVKVDGAARSLDYRASTPLLGKPTPVRLKFFCDITHTRTESGALGFDLVVEQIAALAPFNFDAFEGPDAPAGERKLVRVTVARTGKPPLLIDTRAAGWSPDGPNFAFGVSAETWRASSDAKTLLRALADGADTMRIVIADAKNPKVKLDIKLDVAQHADDFKALLAGVK